MIYDGLSLQFTRMANINRPARSFICPVPCSVKLAKLFSANQPYQKQQPITDPVTPPQGTDQHHYHLVIVRKRRKIGPPSCDLGPLHLHLLLLEASMAVRLFHLGSSPHITSPFGAL